MRVSTLLIATLFILTLPTLAPAATIHVPDDRPTIQAGIDAASPGDTVLIAPGTYTGTGNRDVSFGGKNLVVRSEIGADDTVIDCEGTESDPHRGFFFKSGETSSSVVEGLTIRGGYAPLDTFQLEILRAGGAIACTEESSPTIKDCTFASNYAASWGGALFTAFHSSITILRSSFFNNTARNGGVIFGFRHGGFSATDCNFEGNSAVQSGGCIDYVGGGILAGDSRGMSLTNCSLMNNSAGGRGGAITVSEGIGMVHCVLSGNTAGTGGALVMTDCATGSIEDCQFTENTADRGGGAFLFESAQPEFRRCSFVSNVASDGGGMYCSYEAFPTILNSSFSGNVAERGGGVFCSELHVAPYVPLFSVVRWLANTASVEGSGLYCADGGGVTVRKSTFYGNGVALRTSSHSTFENTIIAFATEEAAITCGEASSAVLNCCDLYANEGGDWVGCIADQYGLEGNISQDPLFCDAEGGNVFIQDVSPCAPAQQPECGLIGALGVGCGPTAAVPSTWGLIKSIFSAPGR